MDDEQEDITPGGDPGPEDEGYSKQEYPQSFPFESNKDDLPSEDEQNDPETLADEAEEAASDLEEAVDSLGEEEQPEDPQDLGSSNEDGVRATAPLGVIPPTAQAPREQSYKSAQLAGLSKSVSSAPVNEAPPPSASEMADITESLDVGGEEEGGVDEDYGEQVNAFNDAGGADGGGDSGFPGDDGAGGSGGGGGSLGDFSDSAVKHSEQSDQMVIEAIRRMDDLTRKLELERL